MNPLGGSDDERELRERAWIREILKGSRAHLDLLYDRYFPRVYRMARRRTTHAAEAERVTEAVFGKVILELGSWTTDRGPSVVVAIFRTARHELAARKPSPPPEISSPSPRIAAE